MPRTARAHAPGSLVHFISRFVDRRFFLDDVGRAAYLGELDRVLPRTDWRLISYALMSSHVHLGLIAGETALHRWVHILHLRFAQWLNRRLRSDDPNVLGPVFADRPTTKLRDLSGAASLVAYHHNNPVRAKVAPTAAASDWTSHRAYVGLAEGPRCLDVGLGLSLCGFGTDAEERLRFHTHVAARVDGGPAVDVQSPVTEWAAAPPSWGVMPTAAELVDWICAALQLSRESLRSTRRNADASRLRRASLRAWRDLGGTAVVMAAELGMSPPAASQLMKRADAAGGQDLHVEAVLAELRRKW